MENSPQKKGKKRLSKRVSLENLSPLAKRLQKTRSSETNKKLDVWLCKKGLIQSPKLPETRTVESNAGDKVSVSSKSANLNSTSRNVSRQKSVSQTFSPNKRLFDWLNKNDLTPSVKVDDQNLKGSDSTKFPTSTDLFEDLKPTTRQLKDKKPDVSKKKLDNEWIKKVYISESPKSPKKSRKKDSVKKKDLKQLRNKKETVRKITQKSTKPAFKRNNSSDSCELPTFSNILNNKTKKSKKITTTKKEQKALFEKYGVHLPTVDEILRDKESLQKDKNKIEQFIPINDDSLEFEPFTEREPQEKENVLHCKHLTNQQLLKSFKKNLKYLSNIISGKIKNQRHQKYFDTNRVIKNSFADLTYNTSTIVFSFDQNEYLIELLKSAFDPDDKKTHYFFQVLLPELCLKIFMETHKLDYDAAVKRLDEQPIIDH